MISSSGSSTCPSTSACMGWRGKDRTDSAAETKLMRAHWFAIRYSRTDVQTLKVLIFMTALAIMVALPIVVATQMAKFMSDVTVNDSVEWKASTSVAYPNITLCNSKYFDKRSLESKDFLCYRIPTHRVVTECVLLNSSQSTTSPTSWPPTC